MLPGTRPLASPPYDRSRTTTGATLTQVAGWPAQEEIVHMGRRMPRKLYEEKERLARRLIEQGLSTAQICTQLAVSPSFLRRVRREIETRRDEDEAAG